MRLTMHLLRILQFNMMLASVALSVFVPEVNRQREFIMLCFYINIKK